MAQQLEVEIEEYPPAWRRFSFPIEMASTVMPLIIGIGSWQ